MRKSVLYPVLALGLGILSAGLRMWQRAAGYDENGLPVPLAVPSVVLTVFLFLCAGAALYLALSRPKELEDQKAALPRGDVPAVLFSAAGALMLAGGCVELLSVARNCLPYIGAVYDTAETHQETIRMLMAGSLLPGVLAVASVPAAAALLLRAKAAKAGGATPPVFASVMPSIFCGVWLINVYRGHTSNPILWDYVLLLLAVAALLASAYERAGFAFGVGKPRRTVFTSHMALLFAAAALPDCGGISCAAFLIALALQAIAELPALLSVREYTPRRLTPEDGDPQAAAEPAESTVQEDTPHE